MVGIPDGHEENDGAAVGDREAEGAIDGTCVGLLLGLEVGIALADGATDGFGEGFVVGVSDGREDCDGISVGLNVGFSVGRLLGNKVVGLNVGFSVGRLLGNKVGENVGLDDVGYQRHQANVHLCEATAFIIISLTIGLNVGDFAFDSSILSLSRIANTSSFSQLS